MTAFGSHCEKNAPVVENSFFIALANSAFTIVNCVCTVAIVGYVTSIEGDYRVYAGPSLLVRTTTCTLYREYNRMFVPDVMSVS